MAYRMQQLLPHTKTSILPLANLSVIKSVKEDLPVKFNLEEFSKYSASTLRFSLLHRAPVSSPLVLTLQDLQDASSLEEFKLSWSRKLVLDERRENENIALLKLFLKAREDIYEALISQQDVLHIHEYFFKHLKTIQTSQGLSIKCNQLYKTMHEFIREVL